MPLQETKTIAGRMTGAIVRLHGTRDRGFGFIRDLDGNEYFLHRTACLPNALFDELQEGEGVSFRVSDTPKGQKAYDLERMDLPTDELAAILLREETRGNR